MNWKQEWRALAVIVGGFLAFYFLPVEGLRFHRALLEAFYLVKWYAQEHVLLCLIPAFFIAGAISVFVSHASVMKYLGAKARKVLAYGVAAVSGAILAVCSCTILPLFAGIYKKGAGLGPAVAFLYAGPAINILAIILTARVLGFELGAARAIGAVVFSIIIGLIMHVIFRKEEAQKAETSAAVPQPEVVRPLWQNGLYFASMIAILVFANWGTPSQTSGFFHAVYSAKWVLTAIFSAALGVILILWFRLRVTHAALAALPVVPMAFFFPHHPVIPFAAGTLGVSAAANASQSEEIRDWFAATWNFAKQILPLLLIGVLVSGFLLGRPNHEGLIPSAWIQAAVGGNSLRANLFAAFSGALMYFATLTEVPILQGLIGNGMGKGPALTLLLAGPALSLPSMLVIRAVMGTQKTAIYVLLVIIMSTASGLLYGALWG